MEVGHDVKTWYDISTTEILERFGIGAGPGTAVRAELTGSGVRITLSGKAAESEADAAFPVGGSTDAELAAQVTREAQAATVRFPPGSMAALDDGTPDRGRDGQ